MTFEIPNGMFPPSKFFGDDKHFLELVIHWVFLVQILGTFLSENKASAELYDISFAV